jgi:hypothetical protein
MICDDIMIISSKFYKRIFILELMHSLIEKEIKRILEGPIETMIQRWKLLNQKYALPTIMTSKKYAGQDNNSVLRMPSISLDDAVEILNLIGPKIFTKQISRQKPELILDFMEEYSGYAKPEQTISLMNLNIYKDAFSIYTYRSIIEGKIHPDADPYFGYDPEHPVTLELLHGVSRGLFTKNDVEYTLKNQDRTSDLYKEISTLNLQLYADDHRPFGYNSRGLKLYEDYGCHVFFGRIHFKSGSEETDTFRYASLSSGAACGFVDNIATLAEELWTAVRKKQRVLLTKSPDNRFRTLSDNDLMSLYDLYFSEPKRKVLPDPFMDQPK